jgi:hypothetical protein
MVHAFLMLAVLVAVALDAALRSHGRARLVGVAAVVLALIPLIPRFDFPSTPSTIPAFFTSDAVRRIPKGSVLLAAPFSRDTSTADSILWQTYADFRFKMPAAYGLGPDENGRYSFLPIPTALSTTMQDIQRGSPPPDLTEDLRLQIQNDMVRADVRSVLVGPMGNRTAMIAFFSQLLGRPPEPVGGVQLWLRVDPRGIRAAAA